jgi:glycosyltransferase involved in cell wall biosynthesis
MKICAHCLVKNEARFIWYAVMSVIKYIDRIRIWDTGSTDGTLEIIEEITKTPEAKQKDFIDVRKLGENDFNEENLREMMLLSEDINDKFTAAREVMLEETKAPWFITVDADEVWWDDSIRRVCETIRKEGENFESIVVPTLNAIEDVFHYQEKEAGRYHLAGRVGHYNLRAINRRIPGLKAKGGHGTFGWIDEKGTFIEKRNQEKICFLNAPYLHATHLRRAGTIEKEAEVFKRKKKLKYELGISFPNDFYYPEVFFRSRPEIVPSPWKTPNLGYKIRAFIETPFKKIRRRTILPYLKHGY